MIEGQDDVEDRLRTRPIEGVIVVDPLGRGASRC
jgi:hypothetical protein